MFISIPKEFFVPIIFGDNYTLNINTQNMEFDTDINREATNNGKTIKNKSLSFISKANGKIYVEIDDEYVNSMTGSTVTEKEAIRLKVNIYSELDDDYVKEARRE